MGKSRMLAAILVLLVIVGLAGFSRTGVAGTDPEPKPSPDQQYGFDPGPGWPQGWTEPPVPTEMPKYVVDMFEDAKVLDGVERLELRVWQPLPAWTREYPYAWQWLPLTCGKTMYANAYAAPDTVAIYEAFGKSYAFGGGAIGGADCLFNPVVMISFNPPPTEEQLEQIRLRNEVNASIGFAQGDLNPCYPSTTTGTVERIHVCLNSGNASEKFDVPAYLDLNVGRVRVPVRFVSEMMRAKVDWDQATETVTIRFPEITSEVITAVPRDGFTPIEMWAPNEYVLTGQHFKYVVRTVSQPEKTITLTVGKEVATVDGKEVKIDAPPVVLPPGRTMVPVRFIAEAMGAKVYWVGADPIFRTDDDGLGGSYQVHIYTPFWPYYESPSWFLETRAMKF